MYTRNILYNIYIDDCFLNWIFLIEFCICCINSLYIFTILYLFLSFFVLFWKRLRYSSSTEVPSVQQILHGMYSMWCVLSVFLASLDAHITNCCKQGDRQLSSCCAGDPLQCICDRSVCPTRKVFFKFPKFFSVRLRDSQRRDETHQRGCEGWKDALLHKKKTRNSVFSTQKALGVCSFWGLRRTHQDASA